MVECLYHIDSYLKEFEAVVTGINAEEGAVSLNRTAFYAAGGGQPSDEGVLTAGDVSYKVTKVKRIGDDIWHYIEGELPALNIKVTGKIDWDLRYKNMRTHTAMHILCGVIWRDYGAQVTGGNMDPLKGRMDFEVDNFDKEFVKEVEEKVNEEVQAGRDIKVKILPREEAFQIPDLIRTKINLLPEGISEIRTVEIVGLDLQADGGTHVLNTREIGKIKVTDYKSKGKNNKRIYIELED